MAHEETTDSLIGLVGGATIGLVIGGPAGAVAGGAFGFLMNKAGVFGDGDPDNVTPGEILGTTASSLVGHASSGDGFVGKVTSYGVEEFTRRPFSSIGDGIVNGVTELIAAMIEGPKLMRAKRGLKEAIRESQKREPIYRELDHAQQEALILIDKALARVPRSLELSPKDVMTEAESEHFDELIKRQKELLKKLER